MKKLIYFICVLFLSVGCNSGIKNKNAKVEQESGTAGAETATAKVELPKDSSDLYGFWVGYFKEDLGEEGEFEEFYDESFYWERENKINISIDRIFEGKAYGHSVVAGNDRPFTGTVKNENNWSYIEVKEPGDNKYDGTFSFRVNDTILEGTWVAFGKIEIPKRKYILRKKEFKYDPDRMLEENMNFVDYKKHKSKFVKEVDEYYTQYATATDKIYSINASNKVLEKKNVENLKKGDLLVIRNSIYARHGYSFKNRALRVFFDAQDWYVPVYADIKTELTEIEKENIQLLLRYEKNAKEYYDYFGR